MYQYASILLILKFYIQHDKIKTNWSVTNELGKKIS